MKNIYIRIFSLLIVISLLFTMVGCRKNPNTESDYSSYIETIIQYEYYTPEEEKDSNIVVSAHSYDNVSSNSSQTEGNVSSTPQPTIEVGSIKEEMAFVSTASGENPFKKQGVSATDVYSKKKLKTDIGYVVEIDPTIEHQTILGFGGALTGTTCKNLANMSPDLRDEAMTKLFSNEQGLGLNIVRQPVGVTDYAVEYYTYNDMPEGQTDFELKNFSIARDKEIIIPRLKDALKLNPDLKIIASVWSPPLWMKSHYVWESIWDLNQVGNRDYAVTLKPECYDVFARYLVKYIKAYEAEGLPIHSLVPQNEPTGVHGIPAAYYTSDTMATLVNNHIIPTFEANGITTPLWAWDFSYFENDAKNYVYKQYGNINGIAFHDYAGSPTLIQDMYNMFDLPIHLTETGGVSGNTHKEAWNANFVYVTKNVIRAFDYGASSYIRWNLILDEMGGPSDSRNPHLKKKANEVGYGVIGYNSKNNTLHYGPEYYLLMHFSKYVKEGAVAIESSNLTDITDGFLDNVSFRNKDGSVVTVLCNQSLKPKVVKFVYGDQVLEYKIAGEAVATIVWNTK